MEWIWKQPEQTWKPSEWTWKQPEYKWEDYIHMPKLPQDTESKLHRRLRLLSEDPAVGDSIFSQAKRFNYNLDSLDRFISIIKPNIIVGGGKNDPYPNYPGTRWNERAHSFAPERLIMIPDSKYKGPKGFYHFSKFLDEAAHLAAYQTGVQDMKDIIRQIALYDNDSNYFQAGFEESKTHDQKKDGEPYNYREAIRQYIRGKRSWKDTEKLMKDINQYGDSLQKTEAAKKLRKKYNRIGNPAINFKDIDVIELKRDENTIYDEYNKAKKQKELERKRNKEYSERIARAVRLKPKQTKIPFKIEYEKPISIWNIQPQKKFYEK